MSSSHDGPYSSSSILQIYCITFSRFLGCSCSEASCLVGITDWLCVLFLQEQFDPITESASGRDLIPAMVYG